MAEPTVAQPEPALDKFPKWDKFLCQELQQRARKNTTNNVNFLESNKHITRYGFMEIY